MQFQHSNFKRYTWFVFVFVFLVILAGGIVRMTQSGMGCPDWPKCFGMWIPPTSVEQLPADFEKYLDKQDIDHTFNVYHTWIEYINRLLGALLGVFIFILFIWSIKRFRKTNKYIIFLSGFLVLLTGFQGFMGKLVVDGNLSVIKITAHMLIAIIIAAVPIIILSILGNNKVMVPKILKQLSVVLLTIVLVQTVIGTQVREEVDIVSKALNYKQRGLWIEGLGNIFYIHRTFSWIILFLSGYLWYKSKDFKELRISTNIILTCVFISMIAGVSMNYLDMPAIAQPIHLVVGCLLSISVFYYRLKIE